MVKFYIELLSDSDHSSCQRIPECQDPGERKDQMNQNDYHNGQAQGQGYGSQPGYPAGSYPGGRAFQGYPPQQGYQQPQQQPYQTQQQPYQAQQPGYQAQQPGYQPTQRIYQTPQVTGSQPAVGGQGGYQQARNTASQPAAVPYQGAYQNPYAQQNYPQGQQGYPGQAGYSQGNGYPQTTGQGYPYQGNQVPGTSYIPQTPYQQPYNTQGYQPVGYTQGYNAYGQMGRGQQIPVNTTQETGGQMPLNGGGYVPQPVPVRRKPFEMSDTDLLVLGTILLILFALGMFVPTMGFLKWVFLVLSVGTTAILWIKPLIAKNKTICYTIVFGLLTLVTVIGFVTKGQGTAPAPGGQSGSDPTVITAQGGQAPGTDLPFSEGTPEITVTPTPEPQMTSNVTDRLETFFYYWSANRQDDMLTLCAPSWQNKVENAKTALFGLMANRTPKDYAVESVSGTDYDTSRTVTITSLMDRNNGKDPVRYRMSIIMVNEGDEWYVDPQSLQTYEAAETPDPSVTETPGPTPEPETTADTILYYNPSGGEYYHRDQNCKRINERYLPLQGHFTYAELSKDKYSKLKPCAICGAPSAGQ